MNLCEYCYNKGMTLEQYKIFESNIQATAQAIRSTLQYKGGMYYNTKEFTSNIDTNTNIDADKQNFIMQELKNLDIEFINDNTLYRVTE